MQFVTGKYLRLALILSSALWGLVVPTIARAVPSMARQTGMECAACHTVFPELTPFGRQFKLRGYTMGAARDDRRFPGNVPLAAVAQLSYTATSRRAPPTSGALPRDREWVAQAIGLYFGGKLTEHVGALVQVNYDGIERATAVEMVDVRYSNDITVRDKNVVYGVTLNNAPTLSDLYNSTAMWAFPHAETAGVMVPGPLINMELAAQVGGVGLYAMWNDLIYVELAGYRTAANGVFQPLRAGVPIERRVNGTAPYWRIGIQRDAGAHSLAVGTFGLIADLEPEGSNASTGQDKYRDLGLDAQYQYLGDPYMVTTTATWVSERQTLRASWLLGLADQLKGDVNSFRWNAHFSYRRRIALGLGYFDVTGPTDMARFNTGEPLEGSVLGRLDNRGWLAELAYLPKPQIKLTLRHSAFTRYNGARRNYDGFGRDAADNDSWYFLAWWAM